MPSWRRETAASGNDRRAGSLREVPKRDEDNPHGPKERIAPESLQKVATEKEEVGHQEKSVGSLVRFNLRAIL